MLRCIINFNIRDNQKYVRPPHWYYCAIINELKTELTKEYDSTNCISLYTVNKEQKID